MKKSMMFLALFVTAASQAAAPNVQLNSAEISFLPKLDTAQVIVDNGPAMAAVQPSAFLKFKHTSCAVMPFRISQKTVGGVTFIKAVLPVNTFDCQALGTSKEYLLQISSDFRGGAVVVLNPLAPVFN